VNILFLSIFVLFLGLGMKLSTYIFRKSPKNCLLLCWISGVSFSILNFNNVLVPKFLCYFSFVLGFVCLFFAFKIHKKLERNKNEF
jgi:hypothetical protein